MLFLGTQCSSAQKHTQHQHIHMHSILKYNHTVTTLVYMDTLQYILFVCYSVQIVYSYLTE